MRSRNHSHTNPITLAYGLGATCLALTACADFASWPDPPPAELPTYTCTSCHGAGESPAPPRDLDGNEGTDALGVGAHRAHLTDGTVRQAVGCTACHVVPETLDASGHIGALPAELVWDALATANGATALWDREAGTCQNYCHGATLSGGSNTSPQWTVVDGTQAACGTCHGAPPPPPHPPTPDCHRCHPDTVGADGALNLASGKHIDGVLDVVSIDCTSCHGSDGISAPPVDITGGTTTDLVTVGAHRTHLTRGFLRRPIPCEECHVVPQALADPGHIDASPAELTWGPLAAANGASPTWDRASATCTNYCHGETLSGGIHQSPVWTMVDGTQTGCSSCHGFPPPPPHSASYNCSGCHPETVSPDFTLNLDTHIDGTLQVAGTGQCGSCHAVPPATGSHLVHFTASTTDATYGDTGVTADVLPGGGGYAFNCGNCHPTDPSHHANQVSNAGGGTAEIDLSAAGAPAGSLKARNGANAGYTPGSTVLTDADGMSYTLGTCSEVYCHSERTVETPAEPPLPGTDFSFSGYPITYPAFTVTYGRAYHDVTWGDSLSCDGCHGMPPRTEDPFTLGGAGDSHSWIDPDGYEDLHGWSHGADPIPCAACHYEVVTDPGVRTRDNTPPANGWSVYAPVPIASHLRHVNGQADVAFTPDPVQMLNNPFDLSGASWDSGTRSCVDVSCHFNDTPVTWGTPYRYQNTYECNVCHRM